MSKQVVRQDDALIVSTREDYLTARKIICKCKGKPSKAFVFNTAKYYYNLDEIKDFMVCGYKAEELVKLAIVLKGRSIESYVLEDFNSAYIDGYRQGYSDVTASIEETCKNLVNSFETSSELIAESNKNHLKIAVEKYNREREGLNNG